MEAQNYYSSTEYSKFNELGMSQHQNTILNGPSGELTMAFKDARQLSSDNMSKVPSNGAELPTSEQSPIQPGGTNGSFPIRPPLIHLDSRATLLQPQHQGNLQQPRLPYPQQVPLQFRAPLQQRPPFPGGQPFVQRLPPPRINVPQQGSPQRQPAISPLPSTTHQQYLQRPQVPFPPPRIQAPRAYLPHQQSLPGSTPASRPFYQAVLRARTLDSTNESQVTQDFTPRDESSKTAAIAAMKNRSLSVANTEPSNIMAQHDVRRLSATSVISNDAADIVKPTNGKIISGDLPPRPESRTANAVPMTRIEERTATPDKLQMTPDIQYVKPQVAEVKKLPAEPGPSPKERKPNVKGLDLKSPTKSEGDNDSGVDESTQGNESNGDRASPRKPTAIKSGRSTATPTKHRSLSRGGKSPNPLSPDSTVSTPGATEKKKIPMNKIQVGSAPSPNLKVVKSKIGSLQNTTHKPGGGNVKIEHKKIDVSNTTSRIAAKNEAYIPGGGDKKIPQQKLQWNVKSKIGSLDNAQHKPKGGEKRIESMKVDFKEKAKPKVGSKDNLKHVAGGGDVKSETVIESPNVETVNKAIEKRKIDLNVHSKVGSFDNVKHKAGGGDKKIFDDKEYMKQMSGPELQKSLTTSQEMEKIPNLDSPRKSVRILDGLQEMNTIPPSRPSSRLSRSASFRKRKDASEERPPWKF